MGQKHGRVWDLSWSLIFIKAIHKGLVGSFLDFHKGPPTRQFRFQGCNSMLIVDPQRYSVSDLCKNISQIQVWLFSFSFCNPKTHKPKTRTANRWETTNSNSPGPCNGNLGWRTRVNSSEFAGKLLWPWKNTYLSELWRRLEQSNNHCQRIFFDFSMFMIVWVVQVVCY